MKWRLGWLAFVLSFIAFEAAGLANSGGGDTFSEQIWWLLEEYPLLYVPGVAFFAWVGYHFFVQKDNDNNG